jgi:hypothetical protein
VTRAVFLAAGGAALATPHVLATPRGVWADVLLTREGTALLTPFTVTIVLHNVTGHVVQLVFPTADLFRIDVLRDDEPVWSSLNGHKPIPITRQIDLAPIDRRAFAPGHYILRVAMLGTNFGTVVDKPMVFDPPATVAQALAAKPGAVITIAGEPYQDGNIPRLRDETGSIRLSHPLGLRPSGTYVVRGFLDALGDDRVFDVGRSAAAYENDATPTPAPVFTPGAPQPQRSSRALSTRPPPKP